MIIKRDYRYISKESSELVQRGFGQVAPYAIYFDRYFSEEQKIENQKLSERLSREEWEEHCDKYSKILEKSLQKILAVFKAAYNIHQVSEETNTIAHFKSDWDLYFYSNKGWNNKDYMDYFSLTFNRNRSCEQNKKLLDEIVSMLESFECNDIYCRVQFEVSWNGEKIAKTKKEAFDKIEGKVVIFQGEKGKVKAVLDSNGDIGYGFFKKGAKTRYEHLTTLQLFSLAEMVSVARIDPNSMSVLEYLKKKSYLFSENSAIKLVDVVSGVSGYFGKGYMSAIKALSEQKDLCFLRDARALGRMENSEGGTTILYIKDVWQYTELELEMFTKKLQPEWSVQYDGNKLTVWEYLQWRYPFKPQKYKNEPLELTDVISGLGCYCNPGCELEKDILQNGLSVVRNARTIGYESRNNVLYVKNIWQYTDVDLMLLVEAMHIQLLLD